MKVKTNYCKLIPFLFLAPLIVSPVKAKTPLVNELKSLSGGQISSDTVFAFEKQMPGTIPSGWTDVSGSWIVKQDGNNRVLAQVAENRGMDFNVAVFDEAIIKDVELSVDIRVVDQSGCRF